MSPPGAPTTLRDVARASGVSITTASRIINGREGGIRISDDTRERVLAAALLLAYRPNLFARGLRGSRSSLLGVIIRDVADPFHIEILRGVHDAARAHDYRLFLGHVDYRVDVALRYATMFEESHADGILVVGDIVNGEGITDELARHHRAIVGVTDRSGPRRIPGVHSDGVAGTRLAMDHLWDLGHRRITCVSDRQTSDARQRIEAYRDYLLARDHGAAIDVESVSTAGTPEPGLLAGRAVLSGPDRPTAVYATSDTIAIGMLEAAWELGITVPGCLSIVGYDDIPMAAFTTPQLTTVSQSALQMGRVATDLLVRMIESDADLEGIEDIVMAPELIVRSSTGPVPADSHG